jgi:hypothetical protein
VPDPQDYRGFDQPNKIIGSSRSALCRHINKLRSLYPVAFASMPDVEHEAG